MSNIEKIEETPSIDQLKELYSHQNRDCWMCKSHFEKLNAGKELKEEELWHFTHCIMSWEAINHSSASEVNKQLEKAA